MERSGPNGNGDFIDLVKAGHTKTTGFLSYAYIKSGKTVEVRVPVNAGKYIVRYIAATSVGRAILATAPVTVTNAVASIEAPASVTATEEFELSWTGPNHKNDYVSIAKKGEKDPHKYVSYKWAKSGNAVMKAPKKPGDYELRYVLQGPQKRKILTRKSIKVTAP